MSPKVPNTESPAAVCLGFVFTVLIHALGFWLFAKLLDSSQLAENSLSWHAAAGIAAIYIALKMWNVALFGRRKN